MKISYCEAYWPAANKIVRPLTELEAQELSMKRQLYTVLGYEGDKVCVTIKVSTSTIVLDFYDGEGRSKLTYVFSEYEKERIFLEKAVFRTYFENGPCGAKEDSDQLATADMYLFELDGRVNITKADYRTQTTETWDTEADISGNWDKFPSFGDYSILMRRER